MANRLPITLAKMCERPAFSPQLHVALSCGNCRPCRRRRQIERTNRQNFEAAARGFDQCSFVTLTYSDENLPLGENLDKSAYQLFLKRLRKRVAQVGMKFSYVIAGEYGTDYGRPHYHANFFGLPFSANYSTIKDGRDFVTLTQVVRECWPFGGAKIDYYT